MQFHYGMTRHEVAMGLVASSLAKGNKRSAETWKKLQWWFEVAARPGRGEGGAVSYVEGDFRSYYLAVLAIV